MRKTSQELIEQCRRLRRVGATLGDIIAATKLPKTTAYQYIRNIPLPRKVQEKIREKATQRINDYILVHRKGKCFPGREISFPNRWTPQLVFLVSHFLFDGSVTHASCGYYNRSSSLIEKMKSALKGVFGVDGHIQKRQYEVKLIFYHHVPLAAFISLKQKELLSYILSAPLEEKRVFLRAFFDDEGCVSVYKNVNRKIKGHQDDVGILTLVQRLLSDFGIQSRVTNAYKDIVITRKENLLKFQKEIDFSPGIYINPRRKNSVWKKRLEKRMLLQKAIHSYR